MLSSRGVQIVFARGVQNREIREKGGAKAVLGGCKRGAWGVQTISRGCNCINEYLFSHKLQIRTLHIVRNVFALQVKIPPSP